MGSYRDGSITRFHHMTDRVIDESHARFEVFWIFLCIDIWWLISIFGATTGFPALYQSYNRQELENRSCGEI